MNRKKILATALVMTGASGIIAQIILLRELLVNFYGNELSIGIILGNWLAFESFGAFFIGKQIDRARASIAVFIFITMIFSLSLPISIYIARILKNISFEGPAEAAGIVRIFYGSFLVLLPVSMAHGALFTSGCKIHSSCLDNENNVNTVLASSSAGRVYIYEAAGAILGGICITFFLLPYSNSFQTAFGLGILNIIMCAAVGVAFQNDCHPRQVKPFFTASILLFIVFSYILLSPAADKIHLNSLRRSWPGQEVVYYKNSIYGNITVTRDKGQYTFFSNSVSTIVIPVPDIAAIEEFVHFPMLFHPAPKNILVIGGGAGGTINEILKHDIGRIDYVELDPLILTAVKEFPVDLTLKELSDPRVNIEYMDGRVFVKKISRKYDVIFIAPGDCSSLSINRLFTKEFFFLLKDRLTPDGIISFQLPGALTYLANEIKDLNACILNALRKALQYTRIIPGDAVNIYMASPSGQLLRTGEGALIKRFGQRSINTAFINPYHIEYKLQGQWIRYFKDSLRGATEKVNRDLQPIATFFSLSYWSAMLSPYMRPIFKLCEKITLRTLVLALAALGIILGTITALVRYPLKISIPTSIVATGFAGMLFNLIIIFTFQIIYGYIFYWLGILVSAFMAGALGGSLWMIKKTEKIKNELSLFLKTEVVIIVFALTLPLVLAAYAHSSAHIRAFVNFRAVFLIISLVSGFIVGMQFPLANKICLLKNQSRISEAAGLVYASDLLGGWLSGMIGGIILLPILGIINSCLVIAGLKLITFTVFALSIIKQHD
jgi:spermidine synthase